MFINIQHPGENAPGQTAVSIRPSCPSSSKWPAAAAATIGDSGDPAARRRRDREEPTARQASAGAQQLDLPRQRIVVRSCGT